MAAVECYVHVLDQRGNVERSKRAESWLRWFYKLILGLLTVTNQTVRAVDGSSRTIRTTDDVNAGAVRILIGRDNTPPTFDDYAIRNAIATLGTTATLSPIAGGYSIRIAGPYTPTSDTLVGEICLYQDLYDTGAAARTVCLFRDVFSPAYLHPANTTRTYVVEVKVLA